MTRKPWAAPGVPSLTWLLPASPAAPLHPNSAGEVEVAAATGVGWTRPGPGPPH